MNAFEPSSRRRTAARVHRAGPEVSHLVLPDWMRGLIVVPIPTADLTRATGLSRGELPGTELTVTADLTALTEDAVRPSDPGLAGQRRYRYAEAAPLGVRPEATGGGRAEVKRWLTAPPLSSW